MRALFQKHFVAFVGVKVRFETWQKLLAVYFMQNDLDQLDQETAKLSMNAIINWIIVIGISDYKKALDPDDLPKWDAAIALAKQRTGDPAAVKGVWEVE